MTCPHHSGTKDSDLLHFLERELRSCLAFFTIIDGEEKCANNIFSFGRNHQLCKELLLKLKPLFKRNLEPFVHTAKNGLG